MSDLLQRIRHAQVQAGEDVVVDDPRRKGLVAEGEANMAATTKQADDTALVMNALLLLMDIYINEAVPEPERLTEKMRFSRFLFWLRQRHMTATAKETASNDTKFNT